MEIDSSSPMLHGMELQRHRDPYTSNYEHCQPALEVKKDIPNNIRMDNSEKCFCRYNLINMFLLQIFFFFFCNKF